MKTAVGHLHNRKKKRRNRACFAPLPAPLLWVELPSIKVKLKGNPLRKKYIYIYIYVYIYMKKLSLALIDGLEWWFGVSARASHIPSTGYMRNRAQHLFFWRGESLNLGVDSPFFSTIVLFQKTGCFPWVLRWVSAKIQIPGKNEIGRQP